MDSRGGTVEVMRRIAPIVVLALASACGYATEVETSSAVTPTTAENPASLITTSPVTTSPIGDGTTPSGIAVTVLTVFDGDSMVVGAPGNDLEVRLLGVNAPEDGECFSDRARDMLLAMASGDVILVGDEYDQYGRLLAYVYVGGANLNQEMVRAGGAIAMSTDHPLRADFIAAEQDATLRGVGLWAPDACGPAPAEFTVSIWTVEADAPGRDEDNLNGEFAVIANSGEPTDMTGWVLRDESSVHRYTFPDGFTIDRDQFVMIRSGCGLDTADDLHWCSEGPVWNNDGDTAILLDSDGVFISRFRYIED
jgi:micrococcal nuclease